MITRRALLFSAALAAPLLAQEPQDSKLSGVTEIPTAEGDTVFVIVENSDEYFSVGVRTKVEADAALITVAFEQTGTLPDGSELRMVLTREAMASVAGWEAYGAPREDFRIPRYAVQHVRATFFNLVGKRDAEVKQ